MTNSSELTLAELIELAAEEPTPSQLEAYRSRLAEFCEQYDKLSDEFLLY